VDFLGLRTLTVIDQALKIIKQARGKVIEIRKLPLDDKNTYSLLAKAQTMGVFQVESSGMRDLLKKLEPERFEDLIALLALYRPGPIGSGMLDDFIKRKHNLIPIKYEHPKLETILKETYGIMVYQEQIMQIASSLAGFSLAQADILRKAMGKKIPEVMEKQRSNFIHGCLKNEIKESIATKIFDLIEYFSGYGFNKSHSTAYALISYRTAYLKANYPVEFMTALLTSERDNTDKIVEYVRESEHMGLLVLPPDINESEALFKVVDNKTISFGLLAVKNVGSGAVESIVEARINGKFASLEDFCQRIDLRLVNRKVLESLIKCGALDCFKANRAQMFAALDIVLESASQTQKEKAKGQLSFFDKGFTDNDFAKSTNNIPQVKEWPEPQLLAFEKEMLGFYITGHPLARYAKALKRFVSSSINDLDGIVEQLVFPRSYQKVSRYIHPNTVVLVRGVLNLKEDTPKIIVNDLFPFEEIYRLITAMSINLSGLRENVFESLKGILAASRGNIPIYLNLDTPAKSRVQLVVGEGFYVAPSEKLIEEIENLLGEERLSLVV
ncbi:MAG: DNA polymerase III subunit alpha, partial [Candidatus Omnitrophica bacterium]|nr:DNA polymerase III subunit alpha [Candidatus Omnitrophota bacterium]